MQFNQTKFAAVIEIANARAASAPRWLKAIERATGALADGSLIVTTLRNGALVTSANGCYRVICGRCQCKAAQHGHGECYHVAAARLVEMYEAAPEPAKQAAKPAPRTPSITRSVERNREGFKFAVVRCDNWVI